MRRALNHPLAGLPIFALVVLAIPVLTRSEHGDLLVYLRGAQDVLHGVSPYRDLPGLPYTYPPFSTLLFTPLTWMPHSVSVAVFTAGSVAAYLVLVAVVGRALGWRAMEYAWAAAIGIFLEPLNRGFELGQVNTFLAALVALDVLVVPRRYRGVLVGIAAGIKLTPAVFGAYFLLGRDWAAAVRCTLSGCATLAIGAVLMPADSALYWTTLLFDPTRIGRLGYPDNQSLIGLAARVLGENPPTVLSLPLQVLGFGLGAAVAWRLLRTDPPDRVAALLALALGGLLASPVSWSHHWVWLVPGVMWLITRRYWALAVAWLAALWFSNSMLPELTDPPFQHVAWAALYPALAMLTLALGLVRPPVPAGVTPRPPRSEPVTA